MNPLEFVSTLFFDVFGTVVDWKGTISSALRSAALSSSSTPSGSHLSSLSSLDFDAFAIAWRQGYLQRTRELSGEVRDGGDQASQRHVTVDEMHLDILKGLVEEEEWRPLKVVWDEEDLKRLNLTWHRLDGWKDSCPALKRLKSTMKVGALTNGNLELMVDMAKHANLPWDFILTADLLNTFKPSPVMYLRSLFLLGLSAKPSQGAMVAAHLYDLEAAKSHGMTTVFICGRPSEGDGGGREAASKLAFVDVVVEDLDELAALMAC